MTRTRATDTSDGSAVRRWPRRRWACLAAATAVIATAVVMAAHPGASRSRSGSAAKVAPVPPQPAAAPVVSAPGGGPVAVVLSVVAQEPVLADDPPATANRAVAAWAAPQAQAGLDNQLEAQRVALANAAGGPYHFDIAVLAVRTTTSGPTAMVAAWCAEVVVGPTGPLYGSYLTEHFTLGLDAGRWLVESTSDDAGPNLGLPASIQLTPTPEAAAALAGFAPTGTVDPGGD